MPPKPKRTKARSPSPSSASASSSKHSADHTSSPPPDDPSHPDTTFDPYEVLSIPRTSQAPEIRKAYHKLALQHHPDKVPAADKHTAHRTFQRIALAYAVLSDPVRRARYDRTGSTSESLFDADGGDGEPFDWKAFYDQLFDSARVQERVVELHEQYRGSDEEERDLLKAYEGAKGDLNKVFNEVMLCNVLDDDVRFRELLDRAIADGRGTAWDAYVNEPETKRKRRWKRAEKEAEEAKELGKEIEERSKKRKREKLGEMDEVAGARNKQKRERESVKELAAAIAGRHVFENGKDGFLARLEAKYAKPAKKKGGKKGEQEGPGGKAGGRKRKAQEFVVDEDGEEGGLDDGEPDEEAFLETQRRMFGNGAKTKKSQAVEGENENLEPEKSRAKRKKTKA